MSRRIPGVIVAGAMLAVTTLAVPEPVASLSPHTPSSAAVLETPNAEALTSPARSRQYGAHRAVELVTRDVYLMGTRATLTAYAPTRAAGLETLESALSALDAAERELSTWRDDSQISLLNRHPVAVPWPAPPALCRMFASIFEWYDKTRGSFDPGIGSLLAAWGVHGDGQMPSAAGLADARATSGLRLLAFDERACRLVRLGAVEIDVGAFGKGEALDRAEARLGSGSWMINLGGQVHVGGPAPDGSAWSVSVAHPSARAQPFLQVLLRAGSLSTSGASERGRSVDGRRISHLLDPRTGRPAAFDGSVTVWHRHGLAADVLSTALFVMGPEDGLRWATAHGVSACFLIPENGAVKIAASPAFANTPGMVVIGQ